MDGEKRRLTREKRRKRGRLCGKDMNIERGILNMKDKGRSNGGKTRVRRGGWRETAHNRATDTKRRVKGRM